MKVLAAILLFLALFPPRVEYAPLASGGDEGHSLEIGWIHHFPHNDFGLYFYLNYHKQLTKWAR